VEVCYHFCSIVKVLCILPGVVLYSVALPFDQVLESMLEHSTVQDFFHNIFFFTINELWRRWCSCTSSSDRVWWSESELNNVEHRVEASHGVREC